MGVRLQGWRRFLNSAGAASERLTRPLRRRQQGSRHPSGRHRPARARAPRSVRELARGAARSRGARVWECARRARLRASRAAPTSCSCESPLPSELRAPRGPRRARDRARGARRAGRRAGRGAAGSARPAAEERTLAELSIAIRNATAGGRAPHRPSLTPRQREVLELIVEGLDNAQIASRLGISERTARAHVSSVLERLGVANRTQAAVAAVQRGWVATLLPDAGRCSPALAAHGVRRDPRRPPRCGPRSAREMRAAGGVLGRLGARRRSRTARCSRGTPRSGARRPRCRSCSRPPRRSTGSAPRRASRRPCSPTARWTTTGRSTATSTCMAPATRRSARRRSTRLARRGRRHRARARRRPRLRRRDLLRPPARRPGERLRDLAVRRAAVGAGLQPRHAAPFGGGLQTNPPRFVAERLRVVAAARGRRGRGRSRDAGTRQTRRTIAAVSSPPLREHRAPHEPGLRQLLRRDAAEGPRRRVGRRGLDRGGRSRRARVRARGRLQLDGRGRLRALARQPVSPRDVGRLLLDAREQPVVRLVLPLAATRGTERHAPQAHARHAAAGRCRAKTGTLSRRQRAGRLLPRARTATRSRSRS